VPFLLGVPKSIQEYVAKPHYHRDGAKKKRQGIPSLVFTSEESLAYIKSRDKDYNKKKEKK
jgi:hypothetical protein